jgi:hypothetical protein
LAFPAIFSLKPILGTRFSVANAEKYHRKKYNMENAVRQNIVFRKLYLPSNWPRKNKKKRDLGQSPSTRSGILSSKEGQFCDDPNLGSGCSADTQK